MNAEQKQRMAHELGQWNAAMKSACSVANLLAISTRMAALLQELIDAPEPEPVAHAILLPNGATRIWFSDRDSGELWRARERVEQELTPLYTAPPAKNQSEQHLEMVNPPALSVPDEFYNAVTNLSVELEELVAETSGVYGLHQNGDLSPWAEILEGGRFERISSLHVVQNLLAAQQPKQPAPPAPSVTDGWRSFLTDVITAAGLLEHGKRDKGLASRIGKFAFDAMLATQQPEPTANELAAYESWAAGEQGKPYFSMYYFAKAAWLARAAIEYDKLKGGA